MYKRFFLFCALLVFIPGARAQVYSPTVLQKGQIDTTSLKALAQGIYRQAGAVTGRQKAEAIWRFFLTDGRYVKPGFWYHIAGWAYEEPMGEVLDPLKLLNSYGFGLCYHIAPLLEAVFDAGGFPGARVWFLTGHTVTEVFYDGAYHYYDSDMMGYTTVGKGDYRKLPVASVHQIEQDGNIILGKLLSPTVVDKSQVDYPWYPADLREAAIGGLTELLTTTRNNWLYPYKRYAMGHSMEFVLRPGERMIRYFAPEGGKLFYLPYKFAGGRWQEFPQEISQWRIRTADGPRSQKDARRWATGRIEYTPVLSDKNAYYPAFRAGFNENLRLPAQANAASAFTREKAGSPGSAVFEMPSPYVIIDAQFAMKASLKQSGDSVLIETSTDNGKTWDRAGELKGPHQGPWQTGAMVKVRSEHGTLTAVSGTYGYLARITMAGPGAADSVSVGDITLTTRFELNPRTLPALEAGQNELTYRPGAAERWRPVPVKVSQVDRFALKATNFRYVDENGQGFLMPKSDNGAEFVFELSAPDGAALSGFDAGGRFLDIEDGIAPDKLTAETRKTAIRTTRGSGPPQASLSWSTSPEGDYKTLWRYEEPKWLDGQPIDRTLRWPEVYREVHSLPAGTKKIYVRYRIAGMALDDVRLAMVSPGSSHEGQLEITHVWREGGRQKSHVERISQPESEHAYKIDVGSGAAVENEALILSSR